jgi:hypothetical protein
LEKQISLAAYWIGIISTVIAVIMRGLAVVGVFAFPYVTNPTGGKIPVSYRTFLEGAILFFIMAIASMVIAWVKGQKS